MPKGSSYHVIFLWLVFSCNTTTLRDEVNAMSLMPEFQYQPSKGSSKPFIDPGFYTKNRQFRLLMCKTLADPSRTPLTLAQHPTLLMFTRCCITQILYRSWLVPPEQGTSGVPRSTPAEAARSRLSKHEYNPSTASNVPTPLTVALLHVLQRQGQPAGQLIPSCDPRDRIKFRWQVQSGMRPCQTVQIWRPSCAAHKGNGTYVSVNDVDEVRLICLHPSCQQRGECNRRLIGFLPMLQLQTSPSTDLDAESLTGNQAVAGMPGTRSHSHVSKQRPKLVSRYVHGRHVSPIPLPASLDLVEEMQTESDVGKSGTRRPAVDRTYSHACT
jgi:hypothetical protein